MRTAPVLSAACSSRSTNGASPVRRSSIALPTRSWLVIAMGQSASRVATVTLRSFLVAGTLDVTLRGGVGTLVTELFPDPRQPGRRARPNSQPSGKITGVLHPESETAELE